MKIKMNKKNNEKTFEEGFKEFINYCKVKNLATDTIRFYDGCFNSFTSHVDKNTLIKEIASKTVDGYILYLYGRGIRSVSTNTYIRGIRTILYYFMKLEYLKEFKINIIKSEKKVKEIYTDAELKILLLKPDLKKCAFTEFRTWTIINFFLTVPVRASTLISIKIENLDFESELITFEKMKNRKQQILPMGRILKSILLEYLQYRSSETSEDFLFPNAYGEPMSVRTLEKGVKSYNNKRGVMRSGLHIFRNVYAKKWIIAGGDIFRLQKLLNHNSLNMVREYVDMFTDDLQKDFDKFNALEQLQDNKKHIKMN